MDEWMSGSQVGCDVDATVGGAIVGPSLRLVYHVVI